MSGYEREIPSRHGVPSRIASGRMPSVGIAIIDALLLPRLVKLKEQWAA